MCLLVMLLTYSDISHRPRAENVELTHSKDKSNYILLLFREESKFVLCETYIIWRPLKEKEVKITNSNEINSKYLFRTKKEIIIITNILKSWQITQMSQSHKNLKNDMIILLSANFLTYLHNHFIL